MNIKNDIAPEIYNELIEKAIKRLPKEKREEIGNDIEIVDWDYKRVFLSCSGKQNGKCGYSIFLRTWNIRQRGNTITIEWTMFDDTNIVSEGHCTGPERLLAGTTKIDTRKYE